MGDNWESPMSQTPTPRRGADFSQELAARGWYHSFVLPDGTRFEGCNTIEILRERWSRFPLPAELHGRRVLDIGAWDGWFTFEAERHGATVTAMDCVEIPNFQRVHRALASRADYRILDFYELPEARLGSFDFVFFLGVLYHLKHPLLALEIVCALTADTAIVESFVTDAPNWREHENDVPTMEFYETDELGNQLDNWIGPTVTCLMAMCRAAGFARVELMHAGGFTAGVACFRKWEAACAEPKSAAPELAAVMNNRTYGINFSSRKEEYLSCWFYTDRAVVRREDLRFEVGPFGIPVLWVRQEPDGRWLANFRLPPGLTPGWHQVRTRFADSAFSKELPIIVDVAPRVERLAVKSAYDGRTWAPGQASLDGGGFLSCWVEGLPENADRANTAVLIDGERIRVEYVGDPDAAGARQVNALIPADTPQGGCRLRVECAGVHSGDYPLRIVV
jgi:tRNA (mo5U34)-methyltransferase